MSTYSSYSSTQAAASTTSGLPNNETLIVILGSVLSVVAVLVVAGVVLLCCRLRQRGRGCFPRGSSPIDDDEIETWKGHSPLGMDEKEMSVFSNETALDSNNIDSPPLLPAGTLSAIVHQPGGPSPVQPPASRARGVSLDSASAPRRTLPNVIVYKEPPTATSYRRSEEIPPRSARSLSFGYSYCSHGSSGRGVVGRFSSDQDRDLWSSVPALAPLTPTALQHACAPNSRAGLTDEAVPGDPSFLPTLKRQSSRLMKMAPTAAAAEATAAGMSPPAAAYAPRRTLKSLSGNGSHTSLISSSSANAHSNSVAYWHARTRSARNASTVSGRSHAGSDASLIQPLDTSYRHYPSQAQMQYFGRPRPPTPPKPPMSAFPPPCLCRCRRGQP